MDNEKKIKVNNYGSSFENRNYTGKGRNKCPKNDLKLNNFQFSNKEMQAPLSHYEEERDQNFSCETWPKLNSCNLSYKLGGKTISKEHIFHHSSGSASGSVTFSKDDKSDDINKNKIDKLALKMKKMQIKEEKKIKREEEIRKKMIGPKSQHLRIIDQSVMDKIRAATDGSHKCNIKTRGKIDEFELNRLESEFPDLGVSNMKMNCTNRLAVAEPIKSVSQTDSNLHSETSVDSYKTVYKDNIYEKVVCKSMKNGKKDFETDVSDYKKSTNLKINCSKVNKDSASYVSKNQKKKNRVKKSDPIEINIAHALEVFQNKQKLHSVKRLIKKERLLSGNQLDSDKPMRRKGKHRENFKKKLSRVKQIILNERQIKRKLMNESKLNLWNLHTLILNKNLDCNDIYFNFLTRSQFHNNVLRINCNNQKLTHERKSVVNKDSCSFNDEINPKLLIHSRKFKQYCDQWPCKEMKNSVDNLIKTVVRFQDRHYVNDPIKACAKRRYVCGFNEVLSYLNVNKVKLVIIATDLEIGKQKGSLADCIRRVVELSETLSVPYVFYGSHWFLKFCFKKQSQISCAAILHYDGAEDFYKNIVQLIPEVKRLYNEKLKEAEIKCGISQNIEEDVTSMCIQSMLKSLTHSDGDKKNQNCDENEELNPFMSAINKCLNQ